jgi:hypothetical protein
VKYLYGVVTVVAGAHAGEDACGVAGVAKHETILTNGVPIIELFVFLRSNSWVTNGRNGFICGGGLRPRFTFSLIVPVSVGITLYYSAGIMIIEPGLKNILP